MSVPPTTYILPALLAAAQQRLLAPFHAAGATSPDRAIPLAVEEGAQDARFHSLVRRGIIVEASPGRYYLDQAEIRRRNRAGLPLAIAAIALLVFVAIAGIVVLAD